MKYIALIFILLTSVYSLSFAKYSWDKKNKAASIWVVILTLISIALPAATMFMR